MNTWQEFLGVFVFLWCFFVFLFLAMVSISREMWLEQKAGLHSGVFGASLGCL